MTVDTAGSYRMTVTPTVSLAPLRHWASDPRMLAAELARASEDERRVRAAARALDRTVRTIAESFPENIFCDLDYLSTCFFHAGTPPQIDQLGDRVVGLLRGFGCASAIRFRYVHDFLYGFDWARWVRKEPATRAHVGPFDLEFLAYLERRQRELTARIEAGDTELGALEPGAYRNPFCFARTPLEETTLHITLAERDLIPVKAWRRDGARSWQRAFTELRAELAERLGFSRPKTSTP